MNDEHFEEINDIVFPTPSKIASVLNIDENFPTVRQVKTTKLEATGQILEYSETYKRGDYYKIKFISCDRDHWSFKVWGLASDFYDTNYSMKK